MYVNIGRDEGEEDVGKDYVDWIRIKIMCGLKCQYSCQDEGCRGQ